LSLAFSLPVKLAGSRGGLDGRRIIRCQNIDS
jgi:hypothetical protein